MGLCTSVFGQQQSDYRAFDGFQGYQSIPVSGGVHYVAYHGMRNTSIEEVSLGWRVRAAQLCRTAGATHYVELAYVFEPLTADEIKSVYLSGAQASTVLARGAGGVYVPVYIPSGGGGGYAMINTPSRLGSIRCVSAPDTIVDQTRLIEVSKTFEEGKKAGIAPPAAK
jgi:hypothetical protein